MFTSTRAWVLLTSLSFSCMPIDSAQAQSLAREFFKAAPAALFYTEDEMSETHKAALVRGGFKQVKSFDCSRWGVAEETATSLVIQYCEDSAITLRSYPASAQSEESVIVVQSSRSSGRANDLSVFRFKRGQREFVPLSQAALLQLGIEQLTENDFLKPEQRFPAHEAQVVGLELSDKGELQGRLETWMDPRWEHRSEAFSVKFVWSEGRFHKVLEKVG